MGVKAPKFNATAFANGMQSQANNQANVMISQALQSAGTYLQGMKGLAGGEAGVPMETMAKQSNDMANLAKFASITGQIPDSEALGQFGSTGDTFKTIAGQPTYENNLETAKLAVSAMKKSSGSSGGGGGSGGSGDITDLIGKTEGERKAYATSQAQNVAIATYDRNVKEGSDKVKKHPLYFTIYSILADPAYTSDFTAKGVDTKKVIDDLVVTKGKTSTAQFFQNNPKLGELYYSKFPIKL